MTRALGAAPCDPLAGDSTVPGACEVLLVRHAEKIPGLEDRGLSVDGRRQVEHVAALLADWSPQLLFTSPLRRARETAQAVAERCDVDARTMLDLVERRVNPAPGTGTPGFKAEWAKTEADRSYSSYDGESSHMAADRLLSAIRTMTSDPTATRIVAVTHGGIIRDLALTLLARDHTGHAPPVGPADLPSTTIAYCSLTLTAVDQENRVSLRYLAASATEVNAMEGRTRDT